jgi:hypothetical protein
MAAMLCAWSPAAAARPAPPRATPVLRLAAGARAPGIAALLHALHRHRLADLTHVTVGLIVVGRARFVVFAGILRDSGTGFFVSLRWSPVLGRWVLVHVLRFAGRPYVVSYTHRGRVLLLVVPGPATHRAAPSTLSAPVV